MLYLKIRNIYRIFGGAEGQGPKNILFFLHFQFIILIIKKDQKHSKVKNYNIQEKSRKSTKNPSKSILNLVFANY